MIDPIYSDAVVKSDAPNEDAWPLQIIGKLLPGLHFLPELRCLVHKKVLTKGITESRLSFHIYIRNPYSGQRK